jgi:hypothetical protein
VRARLDSMAPGQGFNFLCTDKMAEKMDRVVANGDGEITDRDDRSYGVVISVKKKESSKV